MNYKFEAYSMVGIAILLAGLLRQYVYYKIFNFSILPFIEPGEIVTIFFDNLLSFIVFIVLNILLILILYSEVLGQNDSIPGKDFLTRLNSYGFYKLNKLIMLIVLSAFFYLVYCVFKKLYMILLCEYFAWIVLLIIAIYLNPLFIFELKRLFSSKGIELNQLSIYLFLGSLNLFAFAVLSGINEANKVKNHSYYKDTVFYYNDDEKFTSDTKKYYIGKTKQFVFFYDSSEMETEVIPLANIKKMKY